MRRAHGQRALLWGADLSGPQTLGSFWQEADLSGSRLRRADFSAALPPRTCLRGADLHGCDLSGTRLEGADLEGARLPRGFRI